MSKNNGKKKPNGFTLVETVVSIGVFGLIVSIASGGFIAALRTQRRVAALLLANSSMSLVIEQMAREIRTASEFCYDNILPHYDCVDVYTASSPQVFLTNAKGERVSYVWDGTGIVRTDPVNGARRITPDTVDVTYFEIFLTGHVSKWVSGPGDLMAPRITIAIGATPIGLGFLSQTIPLQMTLSARNLDG
jgi:prepilin-type N-terminal cleavage/methylation domain-containing protein